MSHRNLFLAGLFAFSATAMGCRREPAHFGPGRLDLAVQLDSNAAAGREVRGTFTLRSLDAPDRPARRVSIAAEPYRTLSVSMSSGLYSLAWEPERTLEGLEAASLELPTDPMLGRSLLQLILIAPDQVTLLRIRSTAPSAHDPSARVLASRDPG
jgi:hypothetical protein